MRVILLICKKDDLFIFISYVIISNQGDTFDYYNEIKNELLDNEINKKVKDYSKNRYELKKYYNVGKLLFEAGNNYGEGIINKYSKQLTTELGKGYTPTRLRYYRRFYHVFSNCPTVSDKLSWSHYCEIIMLCSNRIKNN